MPLDIKTEIKKIKEFYASDPKQKTFNLLLVGESGSGKTFMSRTARKPVHIDSFDIGGTKCVRKWIEKGEIIVDSRWESEDPLKPSEFKEWKKEFNYRLTSGYFNHFGTYWLSSGTSWSDTVMNYILAKVGLAGEAPRWAKDYVPQKTVIRNYITKMLSLPCDFVFEGHLKLVEDPDKGSVFRFMTTGQGMVTIPLLFDEIYVTSPKETSSGIEYRLLTKSTGTFLARSRLSADGLLETYEKPDLKYILKKVGMPYQDKELL